MNSQKRPMWLLIVIFAAIAFVVVNDKPSGPRPPGPDLLPAFASVTTDSAHGRQDALALATLCDSLADMIEYDATRGDQSRLQTGAQLDDLRRWAREYLMRGESFGQEYPLLPKLIGDYLDAEVGTSGGPVDAETRKRWISTHRKLAKCAEWAAGQL